MKLLTLLTLVSGLVSALPVEPIDPADHEELYTLEERELEAQFLSRNELENGNTNSCPRAILIYARGSTEWGNMGITAGPLLAAGLEKSLGANNIWIQGVGGAYKALLTPNFLPAGTNRGSIDEAKRLFTLANTKCPGTPVFASGYSQGTAVISNALSELGGAVQNQVVGAALFGYTKNQQNGGRIPNYPTERTAVFCEALDLVCYGTLFILPAHFFYWDEASGPATTFLVSRL